MFRNKLLTKHDPPSPLKTQHDATVEIQAKQVAQREEEQAADAKRSEAKTEQGWSWATGVAVLAAVSLVGVYLWRRSAS
jgi:hypothetical protein